MLREAATAVFLIAASGDVSKPAPAPPCRVYSEQIHASLLVPRGGPLELPPVARMFFGPEAARATGLRFVLFSDSLNEISIEEPNGRKMSLPYAEQSPPMSHGPGAPACSVSEGKTLSCSFGKTITTLRFADTEITGTIAAGGRKTCGLRFGL